MSSYQPTSLDDELRTLPRDLNRYTLADLVWRGAKPRYLPFWGARSRPTDALDLGCLSQWKHSPFTVDGIAYATAEHYMMAAKARLFGDTASEARILRASHPRIAKSLGRSVSGFDQALWRRHRLDIVTAGNLAKFLAHDHCRDVLLSTQDAVLVEASPYDQVWGVALSADDPRITDPNLWRGDNLLGFALMRVRSIFKERHDLHDTPVTDFLANGRTNQPAAVAGAHPFREVQRRGLQRGLSPARAASLAAFAVEYWPGEPAYCLLNWWDRSLWADFRRSPRGQFWRDYYDSYYRASGS
ncbi:NADAR family protein [Amycolatopsis anabasis]|uniref:NADAR family protein n=1 Tax=Amycolatopsis anabasis TaxID=1840409 RepID=UPI001FE2CD21|nr:NADAR family protein [Amycolatopsis anabasis]